MSVPSISEFDRIALNAFFRAVGAGGLNHVVLPNVAIGDVLAQAAQPGGDVPDPLVVNGWAPLSGTATITGELSASLARIDLIRPNLDGKTKIYSEDSAIHYLLFDPSNSDVGGPAIVATQPIYSGGGKLLLASDPAGTYVSIGTDDDSDAIVIAAFDGITIQGTMVSNSAITAPSIYSVPVTAPASSGGATFLDMSAGSTQIITLTENTAITVGGLVNGVVGLLKVVNPGAFTVSWPNVNWPGGIAPTVSTTATDIVTVVTFDGGVVYGSIVQNYA